ncbi:MAG: hypothetical protein A2521_10665 [Deltaproteobacteria bacterium RIFOXYD12_FULL_57_12]|nr:MAG: hypothetical protein A2521_10665 [Deltaproteobacteria bacterium RIFOXYD12_FULL_57_12]
MRWCYIFLWMVVLQSVIALSAMAVESDPATTEGSLRITRVQTEAGSKGLVLRVQGSGPPTYTVYELFDPQRIVLDIANASFADSVKLPLSFGSGPVSSVKGRVIDDKKPALARLEIFMTDDRQYAVDRRDNDILISFASGAKVPAATAIDSQDGKAGAAAADAVADLLKQKAPAAEPTAASTTPPALGGDFAGYSKTPISVDFYKIDLHNVFRLFGEISGLNIVVAEGVSGTITLALNNVPWDFALDVILNLKDLQKIERHGTIVIAPKAMEFNWPKSAADNLDVRVTTPGVSVTTPEGDPKKAAAQQGVKVEKMGEEVPANVMEAKKLMSDARLKEKEGNFDGAVDLYEKAFAKWPENAKLAVRLSSLYLVHKGMNAKAVYYAKEALRVDANERDAGLNAAIGLANMKRNDEARAYFDQAVREGDGLPGKPASEALISYAMFNEENSDYMGALLLLDRYAGLYGDTLETMIARARIHDKEGSSEKAVAEYRAIMLSGYPLPEDLSRYINGRLALQGEAGGQALKNN